MKIDYQAHNEKSAAIWQAYNSGQASRVPVTIYADARNWLAERHLNATQVQLRDYLRDPDLMLDIQLKTQEWKRLNILSDDGMGYPESWSLIVDCQNYLEIAWFGGEVIYDKEPHCKPYLTDIQKNSLFHKGIPDPWSGINKQARDYYECFHEKTRTYHFRNIPIGSVALPYNMTGTDGPFTIACGIRGAAAFMMDMMDDPEYAHELLAYLGDSIINRIKAVRCYLDQPALANGFGFADDAIVMLSPAMYEEFILPVHRKIYESLTTESGMRSIHLCGDAQRFFPILQKKLKVMQFDTGFPINFSNLYMELNCKTRIMGGPSADMLLYGTPAQIDQTVLDILKAGVMEKSRYFVLREANALAPGTPLENVNQIYLSAEKYGYYDRETMDEER